ncbi:MAG: cysteine desulfurase NifS, partial [Candidatus Thiodiazotropha taylori]|nr:cysteine desulfurase NifS [Candidatus Thiodiazotropha taylori]MCW4251320.1 cysteine desulfurase NifS [Candidatus Thiodiazotropha taylori]
MSGTDKIEGIYLDNNATTMVAPEVVEEMLPYFTEQFGNPSSLHQFGDKVGRALKKARKQVQTLLGAEHDSEIIFTSCGTESDSTAILSALKAQPDRKEIITTVVEHPAVLTLCEHLEKEGYKVHYLEVDSKGRLDIQAYYKLLSDNVAIVSVMWANNESGTLFPVEEMAELARQAGVLFHTDAVQAVGKLPINLKETCIDMLSLSGHKLHAPKGIGVLYLRRGVRFRPLLRGGHQERGRRAGTENAASIVALGKACEMAMQAMEYEKSSVKAMRDHLEQGILEKVSHCFVTGDPNNRLPNTCNIAFEYIEGEAILLLLNKMGIAASSGSACTSGSLEPSHVMRAMDIPFTAAHGSVRLSLSRYNTMDEIERVIEAVPPIVAQLR